MRIHFSLILLFIVLFNSIFASSALSEENINKNDVKSVIAWKSESPNSTKGTMVFYMEYNKKGNKTITENYDADGTFVERILYNYDDLGNMTEEVNYKLSSRIKPRSCYFDKNDRKKTPIELTDLIINNRTRRNYDLKGNKTEEIKYNADEEIKSRFIFAYTKENKLLLEIKTNADSTVLSRKDYKYDKNGILNEIDLLRFYIIHSE